MIVQDLFLTSGDKVIEAEIFFFFNFCAIFVNFCAFFCFVFCDFVFVRYYFLAILFFARCRQASVVLAWGLGRSVLVPVFRRRGQAACCSPPLPSASAAAPGRAALRLMMTMAMRAGPATGLVVAVAALAASPDTPFVVVPAVSKGFPCVVCFLELGGGRLLRIAERSYQYSSILDLGEIRDFIQFCARGFHVCAFWSWGEGGRLLWSATISTVAF